MSKIFIGGDSWGCGEWTEQTVSHKGVEQYFINDNYTVFNSSEGGSSNKFSIDRLDKDLRDYYISGDIIIWIQTDPIRDLRVEEQGEYGNNIFLHYIELRSGPETQKEHRLVAQACATALESIFPMVSEFVANDQ